MAGWPRASRVPSWKPISASCTTIWVCNKERPPQNQPGGSAMKRMMTLAVLATALACGTAQAQQMNVKIGVLTDMSSLYADVTGPGSLIAAKMAAADYTKDHPNVKVEVISGDHQNKA